MLVYLAGAINGCTDEECKDWRTYVKNKLGDTRCLDPMVRDYRGREMECIDEIVEGDKKDIDNSTHILVSYEKPSVGTSMEILYAWERKIPVYVVSSKENRLSPWLVYHSNGVFHSYDEAMAKIME
jgi:hypothetical protein